MTDRALIELRQTLENFAKLSSLDLSDQVYDELKAVMREHAVRQFRVLFEAGYMHLIRELAAAIGRDKA